MDCDHARQLTAFNRPGELEAAEVAELDQHLASCTECGPEADFSRQLDDALSRAMQAVPLPDGLPNRLFAHLNRARSAWWRRSLASACALGVAGMLASSILYSVTRPTLDLLAAAASANAMPGLWKPHMQALEHANAALQSLGAPALAPDEFDYRFLILVKRTNSHGLRSAPTLVFARDSAYAEVVIARAGEFKNLAALANQVGEDSGCWVAVKPVADHPGWFYIITSYGKPLQFFQRRTAPSTSA